MEGINPTRLMLLLLEIQRIEGVNNKIRSMM